MLENLSALRRRGVAFPEIKGGGIAVRPLTAEARFKLRLPAATLEAKPKVAGFTLDLPINRFASADGRLSMRLGPDEWVLLAPEAEADLVATELRSELGQLFYSLVDIGHRHVAFEISGKQSANVLNAGCALDLGPRAFPAGMATRTLVGKAEILLLKTNDAPTWRLECWCSFAEYVHGFLDEAAQEFKAP